LTAAKWISIEHYIGGYSSTITPWRTGRFNYLNAGRRLEFLFFRSRKKAKGAGSTQIGNHSS